MSQPPSPIPVPATLHLSTHPIPRLAFGLGTLMTWAPSHTHPLPTNSLPEIRAALAAGIRHFDCGDLYTNMGSMATALRQANLPRADLCISLKLNTYNALKPASRADMLASAKQVIADLDLGGYVDVALLHFPPRGKGGNLTNREAWGVLEELRELGMARVVGVSNWTLDDYKDQFAAGDLKYKPQINEYEANPHLIASPSFQARRAFEREHGIIPKHYGVLTPVTGKLAKRSASPKLAAALAQLAREQGLTPHEILLQWAWDNLGDSILVTSTSRPERVQALTELLAEGKTRLDKSVYDRLEAAALEDGYEGKQFYLHPHMDK